MQLTNYRLKHRIFLIARSPFDSHFGRIILATELKLPFFSSVILGALLRGILCELHLFFNKYSNPAWPRCKTGTKSNRKTQSITKNVRSSTHTRCSFMYSLDLIPAMRYSRLKAKTMSQKSSALARYI